MTMPVDFVVPGVPAPQGSKNQFGGEANPRTKPWRAHITDKASEHFEEPVSFPVVVMADFVFVRPRSHYRTGKNADLLRESAPAFPTSRLTGDLDKLQRAVGDALTGVALLDDSQIVQWIATKEYGPSAHLRLTIAEAA